MPIELECNTLPPAALVDWFMKTIRKIVPQSSFPYPNDVNLIEAGFDFIFLL